MQQQISELQVRKEKEEASAKKKYNDLLARVNRGTVRVSIPARAYGGVSADDGPEARAEFDAEAVERLLAVGREGDAAIRDLNQCIDQQCDGENKRGELTGDLSSCTISSGAQVAPETDNRPPFRSEVFFCGEQHDEVTGKKHPGR